MEFYKITDTVIPCMWNTPCKIVVFTDGRHIKIYEKMFPRCASGSAFQVQRLDLEEQFRVPQAMEVYLSEIENETTKAVKQYITEKTRQTKEAQRYTYQSDAAHVWIRGVHLPDAPGI